MPDSATTIATQDELVPVRIRYKRCAKCGEKKPRDDFPLHSTSSDGRASYCRQCRNGLHKQRRELNPVARLKHHTATRVIRQLKAIGGEAAVPEGISGELEKYVGYKFSTLKRALDADLREREGISLREAFKRDYHLDHQIPLHSFPVKVAGDEAFMACWAITNLRMISAADNLAKGGRIE